MRRTLAIAAACLAAALPQFAQADSLRVAIPQRGAWDSIFPELGVHEGFFKAEGLDPEFTYTEGGAANEQAVISGSVDIVVSTGFLGILSAYVKGAPVRIISPEATGAPDIFWYVKAGSPIKSLKEAHGKTVSYSNGGSSSYLSLLTLLKEAGVTDAKLVPIGAAPNGIPQVMTGQLDISWCVPPTGLRELAAGQITLIAHGNDSPTVRSESVRVNVANLNYLTAHRDNVVKFMRAYAKSIDWAYTDPKAVGIYAEMTKQPLALVTMQVKEFQSRESNQLKEIRGEQRVLDEAFEAKRLPKRMTHEDVKGVYDFVLQTKS
jgi:NitT/TauT family transport system substrate-binding protein